MIKVGRIPGKMYTVDFTEGMTVGQAITKARAIAEEQGKSLDVANCQVRLSGSEVNESEVVDDGGVITISQKIKGNLTKLVTVDGEDFFVDENTTAEKLLKTVDTDKENPELVEAETGTVLDEDDIVLDCMTTSFITREGEETDEDEDYDYEDEDCRCENCECGDYRPCREDEVSVNSEECCQRFSQNVNLSNEDGSIRVYMGIEANLDKAEYDEAARIMKQIVDKIKYELL